MADIFKPAFRATSGLDAAGEKVINVAKADFGTLSDGVNVDFFIEENTLQQYDATRGYRKDFAVIQNNRIWVSTKDIAEPAGPFQPEFWSAVRTDPKWRLLTTPLENLNSGDYVTLDSSVGPCRMRLPGNPQDGDTIVIKDIGNSSGYNEIKLETTDREIVKFGAKSASVLLTKPGSYNILVYSKKLWNFYQTAQEERGIRVNSGTGDFRAQAGDIILRRYTDQSAVTLVLPKYANQGDIIRSVDMDGQGPNLHLIVKTVDNTYSIDTVGTRSKEFRTTGDGFFTYNEADKVWKVWDGDIKTRLRIVRDSQVLQANSSVTVFGDNNVVEQTIELTLPTNVAIGDTVKIALNYLRKKQTVKVFAATGDMIATDIKLLQFPKRSEYPPDATWVTVKSLEFNGDTNYTPVIEFSYIEDTSVPGVTNKLWIVAQNVPTVERVDSKDLNTRKRLGVISLASQSEANVDFENAVVEKESAITPETLANRTAREDRRGIARIATTAQATANVAAKDDTDSDNVIMTPFKMDMRTATTDRKGVAETATQAETDAGTLTTHIVTPKTLNDRKASESLTGIAKLVPTTSTKATTARGVDDGTGAYKFSENTMIITPKSLNQLKATRAAQGIVYIAKESEVISGAVDAGFENVVVSPVELHKKIATENQIGFAEIATQSETDAGTDDSRIVTPKKLNDRKAREDLTGIAKLATDIEFSTGTEGVISTPAKIKKYFDNPSHTSVTSDSGLIQTGTLWNHYNLDISKASETKRGTLMLSTQALVDEGLDNTTAVTPAKLQKKKSTESTEGIIQVASFDEVKAGTVNNKAIPPSHLKTLVQVEPTWEASTLKRGFVKISEGAITWQGDDVKGSVDFVDTFIKSGYAISPYELNKTLAHYLPIKGKAADSAKLDNIGSTQFIRKDIDQTVDGKLTLTKETILNASLTSSGSASFAGTVQTGKLDTVGLTIKNGTNTWDFVATKDAMTLNIGSSTLILNTSSGNVAAKNNLSAGAEVSAKTVYNLNSREIIANMSDNRLAVGDNAQNLLLRSLDAGNITANGGGGPYRVLTEKNMVELVGKDFVKKTGDTMGGRLDVLAPVSSVISEAVAMAGGLPTEGTWTSEIKTSVNYMKLPGYMVPIIENGIIIGYEDYDASDVSKRGKRAPGLLAQFGSRDKRFVYQTYTPRPETNVVNARSSQWIRTWNVAKDDFNEWGRVYTTEAPVTSAEIGAVSTAGSAFANLTIRDWLQIGNVRIEPDQTTRTVKFTWIDNP